jgi:minor extracellular protease Epr
VQRQAQSLGMSVTRRAVLHNLGLVVSVLRAPAGTSVAAALTQLRQAMPRAWFDANRRYVLDAATAGHALRLPAQAQRCGQRARIGMIDTRIALGDPALKPARVTMRSFLPAGVAPAAADHGTAVASLLVGRGGGLMPRARLYAAAVFRSRGHGADTDAELVARALDWLVGQKVEAIELSLGSSRNQVLQAALLRVEKRGAAVIDAKLRPYALAKDARAARPGKTACR